MRNLKLFAQTLAICSGLLFFAACQQEEIASPNSSLDSRGPAATFSANPVSPSFYGLGPANELYTFSTRPFYDIKNTVTIQGLSLGETMIAIDVRPLSKILYGVSNLSLVYAIDPSTGMSKRISPAPFSPAINGTTVGFDFNDNDRMVLVSDAGQILTLHPTNGQVLDVRSTPVTGIVGLISGYGQMFGVTDTGDFWALDQFGASKPLGNTGLTIQGEGGMDMLAGRTYGVFYGTGGPAVQNSSTGTDDLSIPEYRFFSIDVRTGETSSHGIIVPMIAVAAQ